MTGVLSSLAASLPGCEMAVGRAMLLEDTAPAWWPFPKATVTPTAPARAPCPGFWQLLPLPQQAQQ